MEHVEYLIVRVIVSWLFRLESCHKTTMRASAWLSRQVLVILGCCYLPFFAQIYNDVRCRAVASVLADPDSIAIAVTACIF
jgi:hypothetical protein